MGERDDDDDALLRPGQAITVQKLNTDGAVVFAYPGVVSEVLDASVRLDAEWTRETMALDYVTFEPGDHFSEWFYTDRWYNIMEARTPAGALKGWYCNIGHPATILGGVVSYRDLILDLWVAPGGSMLTLDEDEFAANISLTSDERAEARRGMERLRAHIGRREAPFDSLPVG